MPPSAAPRYPGFSYLMRMYFHEALDHFEDESIDLLHIDGLHTYDAVKEDFTTWEREGRTGRHRPVSRH
ncbi:MAG: class I SAM-dependent methyltransferase [Candidatus Nanopelagicales bacterium]